MEILPPHSYTDTLKVGHLTNVIAYMREHGAPNLRVVRIDGDLYQAIEGCHRLQAASELMGDDSFEYDVTPEIEELDDSEAVDWDSLDFDRTDFDGVTTWGELGANLYNNSAFFGVKPYNF